MPTILVEYPKERWKKVNISKLLRRFDKLDVSAAVRISDKDLKRLLPILERNDCKVIVTHEDLEEREIAEKFLDLCVKVRSRQAKPEEIGQLATKIIVDFGLENLDSAVRDIVHLATEFSEDHNILTLNELEDKTREILSTY